MPKPFVRSNTLPLVSLGVLVVCLVSQVFGVQQLFSYCGYLVVHFGLASTVTAGYFAGNIAAGFNAGRAVASVPLGIAADRWGRKPILFFSLTNLIVTSILFGLSSNYTQAVLLRIVMGANGIVATAKTMVSEICVAELQPTAMAIVSGSWSASIIIAPGMGGLLYGAPFFGLEQKYPHFLPNLVTAVLGFLGMIAVFFVLPETRRREQPEGNSNTAKNDAVCVEMAKSQNDADDHTDANNHTEGDNSTETSKQVDDHVEVIEGNFWISTFVFSFMSLVMLASDETFNLWAISPENSGGLGWSTTRLGSCLSGLGIPLVLFTLFVYPPISRTIGLHTAIRLSCFGVVPLMVLIPFVPSLLSHLPRDSDYLTLTFTLILFLIKAWGCLMFTSISVVINRAVATHERGRANGINTCLYSIAQAVGVVSITPVFAWSVDKQNMHWFVFVCCASGMICVAILDMFTPKTSRVVMI